MLATATKWHEYQADDHEEEVFPEDMTIKKYLGVTLTITLGIWRKLNESALRYQMLI